MVYSFYQIGNSADVKCEKLDNIELTNNSGIVCDNPNCTWEDKTVSLEDTENWLNKPCPKCGENLLTEEDLLSFKQVMAFLKMANSLSKDDLEALSKLRENDVHVDEKITLSVKAHKGIHIGLKEN